MKYKIITASVLSLALFTGLSIKPETVFAERSIDSINQDITKIEQEIIDAANQIDSVNKEIKDIQSKMKKNNEELEEKSKDLNKFSSEVKKLKKDITKMEEEIEQRDEILKGRLMSYQKNGGKISYLNVIFGSDSFADMIGRVSSLNTIIEADNELIKSQNETIESVEKNKNEIDKKLEKTKKAKENLVQLRKDNENKQSELAVAKKDINFQKNELENKKIVYVKEGNDIEELQRKILIEKQLAANKLIEEKAIAKQHENRIIEKSQDSKIANNDFNEKAKVAFKSIPKETQKEISNNISSASKTIIMNASAYTADCTGCSGITKTGINLKANRNLKVVAVDPSVIPLGSRVWVEGYGEAIAGDTGGAIKGNRIDLHYPNQSSAIAFGRKMITVKILD